MNLKIFLSLFLMSLVLISCKKELEPQDNSEAAYSTPPANLPSAQTPENIPPPTQQPTAVTAGQEQPVTTAATSLEPAKVAKGMNPAHGQPGHRCDIAVGAPLNSAPTKNATPPAPAVTTSTTTAATSSTPAMGLPAVSKANAPATTTAPGMNPPHGQEGHRCEIAVGAPLPKSE